VTGTASRWLLAMLCLAMALPAAADTAPTSELERIDAAVHAVMAVHASRSAGHEDPNERIETMIVSRERVAESRLFSQKDGDGPRLMPGMDIYVVELHIKTLGRTGQPTSYVFVEYVDAATLEIVK
jgi:hypothetical protein